MEPAHLNLGCVQSSLVDERFPWSQGSLAGSEQGLLEKDPIETPTPLEINRGVDDQTQDALCGIISPTPSIIPTVLEDCFRKGNLAALKDGQVPHHRGWHPSQSITDQIASLKGHCWWYTESWWTVSGSNRVIWLFRPAQSPDLLTVHSRNGRTRTADPLLPEQVRYQTALHSDGHEDKDLKEERTAS